MGAKCCGSETRREATMAANTAAIAESGSKQQCSDTKLSSQQKAKLLAADEEKLASASPEIRLEETRKGAELQGEQSGPKKLEEEKVLEPKVSETESAKLSNKTENPESEKDEGF
eukprot:TRINITY_DN39252_c0_g1_i1.p2 TRINITY_DN39252_c0_g1~~TRINITY_DN39252_c0_g1_i1.p2  ORF type:complete len:129 (-),score=32.97 TRINITY_DN39252_c0_g1_i1:13-357(-)